MRKKNSYESQQLFMNYVAGVPYASAGMEITEEDIRSACTLEKWTPSRTKEYAFVVAGIDWGATNYMLILGITNTVTV